MLKSKTKKGFTLIELLVVISIIGLLSTLAVVALGNARVRARDAKRASDMDAVSKAFQLYAENAGTFVGACKDSAGNPIVLPALLSTCVGDTTPPITTISLRDYLPGIAQVTDPTTGLAACPAAGGSPPAAPCNYTVMSATATTFEVAFWMEGGTQGGEVTEGGVLP